MNYLFHNTLRFTVPRGDCLERKKFKKSQLLKKPSIEFYETQDLISPNGKPKLLFHDHSWHFFSLQPIAVNVFLFSIYLM